MNRIGADRIRSEINARIRAVPDPSAPSTTKFDAVAAAFAEYLDLPPSKVGVYWVSKPGNLNVRFNQPRVLKRRPALGVALIEKPEDADACLEPARRLVGPMRNVGAMALCVRSRNGEWTVSAVIEPAGGKLADQLRAGFPGASLHRPSNGTELPGPGVSQGEPPEWGLPGVSKDVLNLSSELYVDPIWLDEVLRLFREDKSIVFYGPPGTGKTYLASKLAEFFQPDARRRELIQLHPSYGYEEFFEGYRPSPSGDGLKLEKRPGPLRRLAELAAEDPGEPVVLILDEMNRGNLPKIFGELYYLLEYRDRAVRLMYSPDETFSLPPNLHLIGTMNTADRSVALIDLALRRRFKFIGLFPGEAPLEDMLRGFLERKHPELLWIADLVDEANRELADRNVAIGPSYFMKEDLDETRARLIWRYSILPTLEDYFLGDITRLKRFDFDTLRRAASVRTSGQSADQGS